MFLCLCGRSFVVFFVMLWFIQPFFVTFCQTWFPKNSKGIQEQISKEEEKHSEIQKELLGLHPNPWCCHVLIRVVIVCQGYIFEIPTHFKHPSS